jgi:hypothetical protein
MKSVKPVDIVHGFDAFRKAQQRLFEARLHWIYLCPRTLQKHLQVGGILHI